MLKIKIDKLSDSFYMIHFHAYCIVFHLLLYSNWFRSTKKWWNQLLSRIFTVKLNASSQVSCFVILLSMKLELPWILRFLASILHCWQNLWFLSEVYATREKNGVYIPKERYYQEEIEKKVVLFCLGLFPTVAICIDYFNEFIKTDTFGLCNYQLLKSLMFFILFLMSWTFLILFDFNILHDRAI